MSKSRLSRFKKLVLCFSVVVSLCFTNFALFSVRASANAFPSNTDIYCAGAPVTCEFSSSPSFGGSGDFFSGSLPSVNVYSAVYSDSFPQTSYDWVGGYQSSTLDNIFRFYYSNSPSTSANFVFHFLDSRKSTVSFSLDSPIVFSSVTDLNTFYNFNIGLTNISSFTGSSISSFVLSCTYIFAAYDPSSSSTSIYPVNVDISVPYSSSHSFKFFHPNVFNSSFLSGVDTFVSSVDSVPYYVLLSASVSPLGVCIGDFDIGENRSSPQRYIDFQTLNASRLAGIFHSVSINDNLIFTDISWTDWLVTAVSGFMDFEIVPGLSFAGMLGLIVGMTVFIAFLKVFAGG